MADIRLSKVLGDEKPLQRSSSKVDAIRRGNLRISGPIPVQPDVEDEDPQPDRSVVSLRVHEAVTEKRSQLLRDASTDQPIIQDTASQDERARDSVGPLQTERSSSAMKDTRFSNGYASTFGQPYSINTERNSVRTSPKSDARIESRRKTKGGSFRAAVRRLFGRKSKPSQPSPVRHGYHRSDPVGLLRPAQTSEPSSTPQRSFSMPIRDITPTAALQSHSPAVQFPRSKELKPLNLRPTIQHHSPHRRATVGSAVLRGDNPATLPKSFDDPFWDSMVPVEERDIGLAVTSGSNPKRRSRSAGALRDIGKGHPDSSGRRRSDEIRYWRASIEERPMSGESVYSGIALDASGPERKVNSKHFRDASDEHAQPLSPRHGRIFDFGPLNEDEMERVHRQSSGDSRGQDEGLGRPTSNQREDLDRTLLPETIEAPAPDQIRHQTPGQDINDWVHPPTSSMDKTPVKTSQGPDSAGSSRSVSATPKPPSKAFSHERVRPFGQTSEATASIPVKSPASDLQEGGYFPDSENTPAVQDPTSSLEGAYHTPEKRDDIYAQPYSEDYIHPGRAYDQSDMPSPLSPNTSTTFEAVSNVLAYERAARKELTKLVYDLKREVAELRSMIESRPKLSAYGGRSGNEEMQTYRSRSSETMDARKTLERLEGYGGDDDHRVTVIRSRFSGFDSVDDSTGGTNEDDDRDEDNDERIQSTSSRQEDQAQEQPDRHHRSPSIPSTDIESPGSEAFETPTEEASGYGYAYDDDEGGGDIAREPVPPLGMRIPVTVGGMF